MPSAPGATPIDASGAWPPATILAPAIELATRRLPGLGRPDRCHRTDLGDRRRIDRPGGRFPCGLPAERARLAAGERIRLPALARTLETLAADGFDGFYDGDLADRQARGLAAAGSPIDQGDLASHRSDWGDPISIEYRGVRVTTHPPNSSGVVALLLLSILDALEPPSADAFGPDGVTDPAWIHLGIEAAKLAMADRDAHLTDPAFRDVPVERMTDPAHGRAMAALIDPRRASRPAPATNPSGGGTVYLAAVDAEGNAVSLIESNYLGFGSGVVDPETGIHYQNRGSYFSLDPGHPNVLEPGKRTLHTLLPGMLFRRGPPGAVGRGRIDGRRRATADPRPARVGPGRRWRRHPDGGRRTALVRGAGRAFRPARRGPAGGPSPAGVAEALEALGHPVTMAAPFDSNLGHEHAIELVDGGPARRRLGRGGHRSSQRGSAGRL